MSHQNLETFNIYQNIHFIGIGGIGISALARILAKEGHSVSGSDQHQSLNSDLLVSEGIAVKLGHSPENIPANCDLVIYTTAVRPDNVEFQEAGKRSLKLLSYPQAVGELTKSYRTVCICGTHGKTTTTALLGHILMQNNADPTVIVGSLVKEFGNKNELLGDSGLLVLESCEYQEAFLNYSPKIIILNNIDPEHLDYFGNAENYLNAFRKFISKLPDDGLLIANGDDANVRKLIDEKSYQFKILTFGREKGNDYRLKEKTIISPDRSESKLELLIPGRHNYLNSTAAFVCSRFLGLEAAPVRESINTFQGTARRFEIRGKIGNTTVVDDYGHAPAEIRATLEAAREYFGKDSKILVIFQPHQYSRTYYFLDDFAVSFGLANLVYIPNIYRSRDTDEEVAKVNPDILAAAINRHQEGLAENTHNFAETLHKIKAGYQDFDAIITIGAGDITRLAGDILDLI
jgi:UDP-N-acetylmuramate--alanine ligase